MEAVAVAGIACLLISWMVATFAWHDIRCRSLALDGEERFFQDELHRADLEAVREQAMQDREQLKKLADELEAIRRSVNGLQARQTRV